MNQPKPNPLREELARSQRADPHPDAGMLTAFAEGALLQREREEVLAHFAVCAECRELVSIAAAAAPESVVEAQTQPLARPMRLPMRSWLPWAVAAAAIVAISSTVLLHQPKRLPAPSTSETAKLAAPAPNENARTPATPNQQAQLSLPPAPKAKRATPARKPAEQLATAPPFAGNSAAPPPTESSNAASAGGAGVAAQVGTGKAPDEAQAAQSRFQGQSQDQLRGQIRGQSNSLPPENAPAVRSERQSAAAPSVVGGLVNGPIASFASATAKNTTSRVLSLNAHWRINALGEVERSFGNGAWQVVLSNEKSKMQVVSVVDGDVWVGGENLQLYHSSDNGTTWTAITLPNKDGREHAITHISFQTTLAGTIDAEGGSSWTTTDGGSTWK